MNPSYDFEGHVALVTGASSGIGLATPKRAWRREEGSDAAVKTRP